MTSWVLEGKKAWLNEYLSPKLARFEDEMAESDTHSEVDNEEEMPSQHAIDDVSKKRGLL